LQALKTVASLENGCKPSKRLQAVTGRTFNMHNILIKNTAFFRIFGTSFKPAPQQADHNHLR